VFFCFHERRMVLLHGIRKTSQKTPPRDLDIAEARQKGLK
jgi:phage-related protein